MYCAGDGWERSDSINDVISSRRSVHLSAVSPRHRPSVQRAPTAHRLNAIITLLRTERPHLVHYPLNIPTTVDFVDVLGTCVINVLQEVPFNEDHCTEGIESAGKREFLFVRDNLNNRK